MARVTVEDCLGEVENRFDLVMLATRRARQIHQYHAEPLVDRENDKPTVLALREIAEGVMSHQVIDEQQKAREDAEIEVAFAQHEAQGHKGYRDEDEED